MRSDDVALNFILKTSKHRDDMSSLCTLFHCLTALKVKQLFLVSTWIQPSLFQFLSIVSCPSTIPDGLLPSS